MRFFKKNNQKKNLFQNLPVFNVKIKPGEIYKKKDKKRVRKRFFKKNN